MADDAVTTTKTAWWKSKALWVAAIGLASAVASGVFGYELDADTQSSIANVMTSIMSAF